MGLGQDFLDDWFFKELGWWRFFEFTDTGSSTMCANLSGEMV